MSNFLLEIGTEEIPHWMIPGALKYLKESRVLSQEVEADATPRRLVVRASGFPISQADSYVPFTGPPKSAGAGAATGFAKKMGVSVDELQTIITDKGEYLHYEKKVLGRPFTQVLAGLIPELVLGIPWPKTMYWDKKGDPRFIRPIRWIVALLGDEIIPFEIAGVKSGNISRGHRVLGNAQIKVDYASHEALLEENKVILGALARRTKIESEAKALGATIDPDLLETLTYITEFPAAIKGDFDPAYLALPAEVLTMVMRHHQKYFAVETSPGVLAPHFVAVMNVPDDPDGLVKRGNERVLKARFNDARFFWEVDQKKKLADRVEDLSHVTFQAKLGTYLEKTHRVVALVKELGGDETAQRAALLAKADLTTEMVKEFTDLQGIVGGLYARAQGEPEAVSKAIYEHYKPLSMGDSIPSTPAGQILAIADKLDNLREFFRIDMVPTGSRDPFGLRRAAQGIFKILVNAKLACTLKELSGKNRELIVFMEDRYRRYFTEVEGFRYDIVEAVLVATPAASDGIGLKQDDFEARLTTVSDIIGSEDFRRIVGSIKRIRKIREQANFLESRLAIVRVMFDEGPERRLFDEYIRVVEGARQHLPSSGYSEFLKIVASTRPAVDEFFDKVMVMDQHHPDIRERRLELLYRIDMQFNAIADFSRIVIPGDQK